MEERRRVDRRRRGGRQLFPVVAAHAFPSHSGQLSSFGQKHYEEDQGSVAYDSQRQEGIPIVAGTGQRSPDPNEPQDY